MTRPGRIPKARTLARGRRAAGLLLAAMVAGVVLRLLLLSPEGSFSSDSFQYLLLADSLAAGEGYVSGGSEHPDLSRPPLLPCLVATASFFTGDARSGAYLVTVLCSALAVVPLFFLARGIFGARAALASLPLGALSCLAASAMRILPAAPHLLLFLSAAAVAWAAARRGRPWLFLMAGALAGGAALARSEGLALAPVLALWVVVDRPGARLESPGRMARAALLLVAATALYAPYSIWASQRLGRAAIVPSMEYMATMRRVSDNLGLRWVEKWIPWQERAQSLLTADHTRRVLEVTFETGEIPEADPGEVAISYADVKPDETPSWRHIAWRRLRITAGNLMKLPKALKWGHFLPVAPVALGLMGLLTGLNWRRGRGLGYLFLLTAGAVAPILSHLEGRFLYTPFALGLVVAAGGWGWLDGKLRGLLDNRTGRDDGTRRGGFPGRRPMARVPIHLGLGAMVLAAGIAHSFMLRFPPEIIAVRQEVAASLEQVAPGALLAVQPHLAYHAGRAYRMLPVGPPSTVLDYARASGASLLVMEGSRDLRLRPDLMELGGEAPPRGFRLLLERPDPRGGTMRVFALTPPGREE
jgi:hypothetical protein